MRAFWRAREDFYLKRYPERLAKAVEGWKGDPAGEAERLTSFTVDAQCKDFGNALRLFDELMWYVIANNRIEGDGSGATSQPKAPFKAVDR